MRSTFGFTILRVLVFYLQLQLSIVISTLPGVLARVGGKLEALALASVAARLIVAEVETNRLGEEYCRANHYYVGPRRGTQEVKLAGSSSQIASQISSLS